MAAVPRKVRGARDAEACLRAAREAGLAPQDWAHANGIDARSLHMWRVLLGRGRRGDEAGALRLVELVTAVPVVAEPARYRVICGAFTIEIDGAFEDDDVARLLRLLRAC